jgi:hypothetical protein
MATVAETRAPATWAWERYSPLAGVIAVACWVVGAIVLQDAVDGETGAELVQQYNGNEGQIAAAGIIWLIGTALFFWFLGSLRSRLLAAEGPEGRLTTMAFAGGVAATVCIALFPGPSVSATFVDDKNLDGSAAVALDALGDAFFVAAEYLLPVMLAATALLALRTRAVIPRWLAWVTLAVALVMLIAPIGWAAMIFAFPIWVVIVSVLLWMPATTARL